LTAVKGGVYSSDEFNYASHGGSIGSFVALIIYLTPVWSPMITNRPLISRPLRLASRDEHSRLTWTVYLS
jgi:hypothetical protein